jgi:cytochrome c-type biogenesis protein
MLMGRNPFQKLATAQTPALRNPYLGAFVYGTMLGPMTLPCAGPIVVSAFLIGAGSFSQLAGSIAYFIAFGLGFGWPLVLLPLVAQPFQRQFTAWTARHYRALTAASGALLIGIGIFGFAVEVLPNL